MVQLDAGWVGPDSPSGAYKNKAEVIQAETWYALGGRQGVLKGMSLTGVAGQMAISVAAGAGLVSRRDGSNNVQDMGYLAPVPTATQVPFGPASASARNDALVLAVVDTTDGAHGTADLANGGHLVVVPGVSGTTTIRTDAQIAAYLGRGGFIRLADVPIVPGDTQINMANVSIRTSLSYTGRLIRIKQNASLVVASTTPTVVPGTSQDIDFVAGQQYEYALSVDVSRTAALNNPVRVALFVDGSQLADSMNIVIGQGTSTLVGRMNGSVADFIDGLSGTHTVDVRAYHDSGTTTSWTVNAVRLVIKRI